ncbi:MAG: helix-turn-helix transcriptional regulator [Eubacteriales bacterium]|nr:helix-turn-helix transcriptional regulator [Eubacteriales bacterium]
MNLGETIRSFRAANDMTQKELADKLSISPSTIGMYEQGRRVPDLDTISKIANVFNVTVGYLIGAEKSDEIDSKKDDSIQIDNSYTNEQREKRRNIQTERLLNEPKKDSLTDDEAMVLNYYNQYPNEVLDLLGAFCSLNRKQRAIIIGKCFELEDPAAVAAGERSIRKASGK